MRHWPWWYIGSMAAMGAALVWIVAASLAELPL